MNIQKKDKKIPDTVLKDRGDVIRKNRKEHNTIAPRDRGDVKIKRNIKNTRELFKSSKPEKAESLKTSELVSRSTNTFAGSAPVSFKNPAKRVDDTEKCVDFRKRIKDRYTFKRRKVEKDGDISRFNYVMQVDVKNELPKASHLESSEKQKSKESRDVKMSQRVKNQTAVNRAVSAMKLKLAKPTDDLAERKKYMDKEKNRNYTRKETHRKPLIKTLTSKMDAARVFKAVTFVESVQRKPLHIKIPNKNPNPSPKATKIPLSTSKPQPKRAGMSKFVRAERVLSPSSKSADSLATEVAQWVPESITQHTKPYYEAWVDKTATASTVYSVEMESVKSTVLRSLETRNKSPELVYQRLGEEYAGKIRVRRKGHKIVTSLC